VSARDQARAALALNRELREYLALQKTKIQEYSNRDKPGERFPWNGE
jgi:hypothetical protein